MAWGLSQAELDMVAQEVKLMYGSTLESVTIVHRETPSASPVEYGPFDVPVGRYNDYVVAMAALTASDRPMVLRDDARVLLPTEDVTWTPTIYTEVIRASGTWRVLSIAGGPGMPFYVLQIRKPTS